MTKIPIYEELVQRIQELEQAESERKQAEESLRKNKEHLESVFRAAPIGIGMVIDRVLKQVNERMCEMTGYTEEELIGQNARVLYASDEDYEYVGREKYEQIRDHGTGTVETRLKHKDGRIIDVLVSSTPKDLGDPSKGITFTVLDITYNKRTKEALVQSKHYYRTLLYSLHEDILVLDRDYRIMDMNNAVLQTLGKNREEIIGRHCYEVSHGLDTPCHEHGEQCGLRRVFDTGEHCNLHHEHVTAGGRKVHVDIMFSPMKDKDGNITHVVEATRDVTDLFKAQDALLESEKDYKRIFNNSIVGFFQSTPEGRFEIVNPAFARMLGYESPEDLVFNISDIATQSYADPGDRRRYKQILQQDGKVDAFEFEARCKDGSKIWVSSSTRAYFDEDGKVVRYEGVIINITKRKQLEEERKRSVKNLRKSEKNYRELVQNANSIILRIDTEGKIIFLNKFGQDLFGYSEEEIVDKVGIDILIPKMESSGRNLKNMILDIIKNPEKYIHNENENIKKNGDRVWVSWTNKVIKNEDDEIIEILCIGNHITGRKLVEEKLRQALKMESIGTLAGGIAHDFNNILSSVIGYTELSLDAVEEGSRLEGNLQEVFTAGLRARDLVKQILTFARQAGEELKPVQVDIIAKEALKFLRSSIPTTVEIDQDIESDSLILADPTQVHQILMNLCTNAGQAMEEGGGVLRVGLTDVRLDADFTKTYAGLKPGDYLKLSISDTGCGISPKVKKSIFDPYFTTKAPGEGTGMGLATTHGIVKQCGGEIMVESKVNKGSTFTVYLPITKKRTEAELYKAETLPVGTEQILFVDDELSIANMGGQILEKLGYQVTVRTSSVEALALFKFKPKDFDLVITDMTMPNMTGDRLAVELMKIRPDIPVILCTGYSKKLSEETVSEMGIKALVYKPIAAADLAKTIRKVLDDKQGKKIKQILLIDDDPQLRKLFIQKLVGRGYDIIEASDGNEGIKRYRENKPDLVITDLVMPEKEGIEMITELKKDDPNLKIIAISGGGRNDPGAYLQIAKTLGAARTFSKPIDWPKLIETIKELLN